MSVVAKIDPKAWLVPTNKAGLDELSRSGVRDEIERGLPRLLRGASDRLVRAMITECSKNPALYDCTPASLFGAVIQAGQIGLVIGGPLGESYVVPFYNNKKKVKEATLIVGYKGFVQLSHRSGQVRRLTPRVVRADEQFAVRYGTDQAIVHQPVRNSTAPVSDYYVCIETINGGQDFETMTAEQAVEFRDRYSMVRTAEDWLKAKSPWYDQTPGLGMNGFDSMALKTLIRRLAKRMPLSVEMSAAVGLDEAADAGEPQNLGALVDAPEGDRADQLRARLDQAKDYVAGVDDPALDQKV